MVRAAAYYAAGEAWWRASCGKETIQVDRALWATGVCWFSGSFSLAALRFRPLRLSLFEALLRLVLSISDSMTMHEEETNITELSYPTHRLRLPVFAPVVLAALAVSLAAPLPTAYGTAFSTSDSGVWDSDTGAGGVWTPDGGPHFFPISGDTVQFGNHHITVSTSEVFSGGGISVDQNPFMTLNSNLNMDAGTFTFNVPEPTTIVNGNGGVWDNDGIFNHSTDQSWYWKGNGAGITFQNDNELNFTVAGGSWDLYTGTASIDNNALLRATANAAITGNSAAQVINNASTGTLRADNATLKIQAALNDTGGTIEAINGGTIRFSSTGTGGGHTTVAGTTFNAALPGDTIRLGGRINSLEGTISGTGAVQFQEPVVANQALSYFDFGATEIRLMGAGGSAQWDSWPAGNVMEARSPMRHDGSGGYNMFRIDGTFRNVLGNTVTLDNGDVFYFYGTGGGATFENLGTLDMVSTTNFHMDQGTAKLLNTGTLRATSAAGALITGASATQTFDNQGTVIVDGTTANSTLTINGTNTVVQFDGVDTLTGGDWRVLSGANTATLNLNSAPNGSITTVGAGATVVLSGANPVFPELSTTALNVKGTFDVQDQYIHSINGNLLVDVGGTLAFGLMGADEGATLMTGLTINGDVTFTGGLVDIFNAGDLGEGTYRLIEWTGTRVGALSLNVVPDNGLTYVLTTMDTASGFVQLNVNDATVTVVPEPATAALVLLGAGGLMCRRRAA